MRVGSFPTLRDRLLGTWALVAMEGRRASQSVVHRIEASLFPNWAGAEQTRWVTVGEDELVLRSKPLAYGGEAVEFWTRWVRSRATETPP